MKKTLIFLVVIIALYLIWTLIQTKPDTTLPVAEVSNQTNEQILTDSSETNNEESGDARLSRYLPVSISFKGFGPGKKHDGTFSDVDSKLFTEKDGKLSGFVTVEMNSLSTDTEGVTKHLKTDAFFDVEKFPTATFTLSSLANGTASGSMTIHGVTKVVSFPVVESDESYSATFNINMKEFGIDQTFANETIELSVTVKK